LNVCHWQLRDLLLTLTTHKDREDDDYPETLTHDLVAPSDFQPFFTLIEDSHTGEHHHPHVHYIFSDDDPDLLTTSILDSSQPQEESEPTQRVILVDLNQDGKTVERIHSLSPDWQVSQVAISQAPSWNEATPERTTQGMMLKIDGVESRKSDTGDGSNVEQPEDAVARMESVIVGYGDKLARFQALLDTCHTDDVIREQAGVLE